MHPRRTGYSLACAAVLWAASACAADAPAGAASCATCHGPQGEGSASAGAPRLAGQGVAYLEQQLRGFRAGSRGYDPADTLGAAMRAIALGLSDDSIRELAAYYAAARAAAPSVDGVAGDVAAGRQLYAAHCAACHGRQAQGYPQLQTPNLAILDPAYVREQLRKYIGGQRGGSTQADQHGRWMRAAAANLTGPAEVDAVARYLHSLGAAQ